MKAIELVVEKRDEIGSAASRRMRKQGFVPAVIYAGGAPSMNVKMDRLALNRQIKGAGSAQLFTIKSDVKELDGELALIRAMEIHPIRQEIQHVDLFHIQAGVRISVSIPVEIEGTTLEIKTSLAVAEHLAHEIEIECLPGEIPAKFVVDISKLEVGDALHASDVALPEGCVLKSKPDITVVTIVAKRAEKGDEPAAATAEAAKPEAAAKK